MRRESQNNLILNWMQAGHSITPAEAFHKFGCLRLCARIFDLKKQGHNISTEIIYDNDKRYASYSLRHY